MSALDDAIRELTKARYSGLSQEERDAIVRSDPRVRAMLIAQGKDSPKPWECPECPPPACSHPRPECRE